MKSVNNTKPIPKPPQKPLPDLVVKGGIFSKDIPCVGIPKNILEKLGLSGPIDFNKPIPKKENAENEVQNLRDKYVTCKPSPNELLMIDGLLKVSLRNKSVEDSLKKCDIQKIKQTENDLAACKKIREIIEKDIDREKKFNLGFKMEIQSANKKIKDLNEMITKLEKQLKSK